MEKIITGKADYGNIKISLVMILSVKIYIVNSTPRMEGNIGSTLGLKININFLILL
tara:strand:- start:2339 stop:2506 length:168 start_codon:yes stop_codon:yes gene_type:complete